MTHSHLANSDVHTEFIQIRLYILQSYDKMFIYKNMVEIDYYTLIDKLIEKYEIT